MLAMLEVLGNLVRQVWRASRDPRGRRDLRDEWARSGAADRWGPLERLGHADYRDPPAPPGHGDR